MGNTEAAKEFNKQSTPLGLMPVSQFRRLRIIEICRAIERYADAGVKIPEEWVSELSALCD